MDVEKSFSLTIQNSSLRDASIDIFEASLDSLIQDDVLKEIPIVKTFIGVMQAGMNLQDKLFLKKILTFLQQIDEIPEKERKEVIKEIDASDKYSVKVGEKLLYILNSCDDHTHAENVAMLFSAMLKRRITYPQYVNAAQIIARLSKEDLEQFLGSYTNTNHLDDSASNLSHTGLVYTETDEVGVEIEKVEQANWKDPPAHYEAKTYGGGTIVRSTSVGDTVFEVFGIGKEKLEQNIKDEQQRQKVKVAGAFKQGVTQ